LQSLPGETENGAVLDPHHIDIPRLAFDNSRLLALLSAESDNDLISYGKMSHSSLPWSALLVAHQSLRSISRWTFSFGRQGPAGHVLRSINKGQFSSKSRKVPERLAGAGVRGSSLLEVILAFFMDLLAIHHDVFGSVDANAHFLSLDCYNRYVDIVANNDLFPDLPS